MVFDDITYSILIVSSSANITDMLKALLPRGSFYPIVVCSNAGDAKRRLIESSFDIIIINSPLSDETGKLLAENIADSSSAGVLMLTKNEYYEEICGETERYGILTLPKPVSRQLVYQTVRLLCATCRRLKSLKQKSLTIEEKMEEIRLVNHAKWILIEARKITEAEAHKAIEKSSMDKRVSKKEIAEQIIKAYESNELLTL